MLRRFLFLFLLFGARELANIYVKCFIYPWPFSFLCCTVYILGASRWNNACMRGKRSEPLKCAEASTFPVTPTPRPTVSADVARQRRIHLYWPLYRTGGWENICPRRRIPFRTRSFMRENASRPRRKVKLIVTVLHGKDTPAPRRCKIYTIP